MSVTITIDNAVKRYGDVTVLPGLSARIENGEFFTLLGPSGCGKTTLLRMIAGFASIEGGEFYFDGNIINNIPAHKRNIGMVFQNYAIFPHLTVRQNVEYGLKIRKVDKDEIKKRVDEILEVTHIKEYEKRLPENLSGGQQQRVALARAVVIHPSLLLMDEPLSNLDAKLRVEMRSAIRDIQRKVGITTIYVTHDQEEALAISDRIAVMNEGVIQQIGSPESIYSRPYNIFVSTFIGHSNQFNGRLEPDGDDYTLYIGTDCAVKMGNVAPGAAGDVLVSIRPEEFVAADSGIPFTVADKIFLGKYVIYHLSGSGFNEQIQLSQDVGWATRIYAPGDVIRLMPNAAKINIYTTDGAKSLMKGVIHHGA